MATLTLEAATKVFPAGGPSNPWGVRLPFRLPRLSPSAPTASAEAEVVYALREVDLQIENGEAVSIVGPSGCGKTTLLRVLAGLETLTSGKVFFDGEDVTQKGPRERSVAMVFQDYALYPHWESVENLAFYFRMHDREQEIPERVRITSQTMGIGFEELLSRKPPTLSGGQKQRVAIARAIVRDPRAFLFDEPLSNLDAALRSKTRVEIKRLIQRFGITTVYVTHDQREAFAMADRVAVMHEGRILQVDSPRNLIARPRNLQVAQFINVPSMNLMPGVVRPEGLVVHGRTMPAPPVVLEQYQGEQVTVGVRPADVELAAESASHAIPARVDVIEPLLSERMQLLTVAVGKQFYRIERPQNEHHRLGELIYLVLPPSRMHVFDSKGRRVS